METDIRAEAQRLGELLGADAVRARLMGGLAVWLRCPSVRRPPFERPYADLDLVAPQRERAAVSAFLEIEGYVPDKRFNTLYGSQRLYYAAPTAAWTVDVIFDRLSMSHELDLRGRLATPEPTLPLADLLLSKLQIWEINRKDIADALCLLADHPLGADQPDAIDVGRITAVLRADWGFCHTVERNLGKVVDLAAAESPDGLEHDVSAQVTALRAALEAAPKTLGWRARARLGERVRWYETPEEIEH
ncbi:MAG: hypothetical protein ABSA21_13650 [Candidatus Limnocylindrales bacterium]|jgi:hypothetical protein